MASVQAGSLSLQVLLMDPFWDLCFYHINVLRDGLKPNVKLFAGNTSLYSVAKNKRRKCQLSNKWTWYDSKWAYNWNTSFNPDPKKSAHKFLFSRKNLNITHPFILFNNVQKQSANQQKRLSIIHDEKLNFKCHIALTRKETEFGHFSRGVENEWVKW